MRNDTMTIPPRNARRLATSFGGNVILTCDGGAGSARKHSDLECRSCRHQSVCRGGRRTVIIDVFNHFMPKAYLDRLAKLAPDHIAVTAFPRLKPLVDVDARLRLLDQFGDLRQVICLANPPLELVATPAQSPELARLANDTLAEVCGSHPDRFPAFIASLPMNNVDACLTEIDRAVTQLGARGIQVFTNVAGKPLSAGEFRPIFEKMVAHDLPVFVHPMRGPQFADYAVEKASENEIWFSFGWPYETTACMTRLIYSGIFDEMPTLKIISHHMGGMIPYFGGKIKLGFRQIFFGTPEQNPIAQECGLKKPPIEYFKMLYADTALGEEAPTRCGHAFFGTGSCLFATDAPFDAEQGRGLIANSLRAVEALEISRTEHEQIFSGNAKRLLRL
ncbi:MAG: amidohydrolase family protein [Rhizobiales bacterium]|nr:amidohydrolase family protein [Hyphomicrobiales bacterium]